jgi:hypothetical protein
MRTPWQTVVGRDALVAQLFIVAMLLSQVTNPGSILDILKPQKRIAHYRLGASISNHRRRPAQSIVGLLGPSFATRAAA